MVTLSQVQRVTKQAVVEEVALLRSGGPLGLSIIGGSDHSCIPFGTGEQVNLGRQTDHKKKFMCKKFVSCKIQRTI